MFSKLLLISALALSVGTAIGANYPFDTQASVAIVQDATGNNDTRVYFQPNDGTITELSIGGTFDTQRIKGSRTLVPESEVLKGTPISAVAYKSFDEARRSQLDLLLHLFFLSPERIVSEYFWNNSIGWLSGDGCPQCLTHQGFKAAENQNALSATINPVDSTLAVGFVTSPRVSIPETLVEAIRTRDGGWNLAALQDNN